MKKPLVPSAALAALLLLNGCQTPPSVATNVTAPANRDAEIARILALKARGVINEAQALRIIAALVGDEGGAVAAAPTVPDLPPPAVAPTTPSAAPSTSIPALPEAKPALDPRYRPQAVLTGRLRSVGSDTMDLLVARWEELFTRYHPGLKIVHEGRGSSTAAPSLMEGQSDFGPMSRAMQAPEVARFQDRFGYAPTEVRVAIDALGLYVHPSNPVSQTGLTLEQVDAIFSATRKRGGAERLSTWSQLGVGGAWANAPINVYGRNKASGTYGFFRDSALSKGEFGDWVREQPGSAQVVEQVAADKFGIGYSGVGYKTGGVALAPLVKVQGEDPVEPSEATALSGDYPLSRPLYLATKRDPSMPLSDLQREFLTFVLGPIGQDAVKREGYYPLPASLLGEELSKLK